MKIFATSDIHGNKTIVSSLVEAYSASDADILLICGDVGGKRHGAQTLGKCRQLQLKDYTFLVSQLQSCGKPFHCVLGNDDWFEVSDSYCLTTGQRINNIVAFDYINLTPFNTNREANEKKISYELEKLQLINESIIIAHCPPYEAQDKITQGDNVGSKSIRKCIESQQPRIWFCGHIHEDFGVTKIGQTLVVNCASDHASDALKYVVVDVESMDFTCFGS